MGIYYHVLNDETLHTVEKDCLKYVESEIHKTSLGFILGYTTKFCFNFYDELVYVYVESDESLNGYRL